MTTSSNCGSLPRGMSEMTDADSLVTAMMGGDETTSSRNPLLCFLCEDYYNDPCILICFHTFCAKCVRTKNQDGKINCPLCGTQTTLKEGVQLPPPDYLMCKLIEMVNIENPPCANCDKRDSSSMYFCSTCGQALCKSCRENTHRAKMFSSHDIVQMSKRLTDKTEICPKHDEKICYFSNTQKHVICTSCVREKPPESRKACVDIDVAYNQNLKKLDRALISVYDMQSTIREGVVACHTLLEELRQNTDTEKLTIHNFVQALHDAINKIQTDMHLEVQRQYEIKERAFRNQLLTLSAVLPILQHHILLCRNFVSSSNKYYFLEIVSLMLDRLNTIVKIPQPTKPLLTSTIKTNYRSEFAQCLEPWFGKSDIMDCCSMYESARNINSLAAKSKENLNLSHSTLPSKRQHSALKAKALEGEGPFSNHCRSFDTQIKELGTQLSCVKDRLNELQREVKALQGTKSPAVPPLILRHQNIIRDCLRLNDTLERNRVELERLRSVFQTIWQEQLYRIHVEQDIFQSQMTDITNLQSEVKQLATLAQQLDPYVKRLTSKPNNHEMADLKSLLDRLSSLQQSQRFVGCHKMESHCMNSSSPLSDTIYVKDRLETPVREKEQPMLYIQQPQLTKSELPHFIDKACVRDKTFQEFRERSKSEGRIKDCPIRPKSKSVASAGCVKNTRACSLYQMIDIRDMQRLAAQSTSNIHEKDASAEICDKLREYLKDHLKKKLNVELIGDGNEYLRSEKNKNFEYVEGIIGEVETISCEGSKVFRKQGKIHKKAMPLPAQDPMPIPVAAPRKYKRYPHSDTEDGAMYQESISFRRNKSPEGDKSTRTSNSVRCRSKKTGPVRKQRSWETFPTRKKSATLEPSKFCRDPESFRSQFDLNTFQDGIRKADSFEGHEEAVSSLVREFHKVRSFDKKSKRTDL